MDDMTVPGDWIGAMQDQFAGDLARLVAAGSVTAAQQAVLLQVMSEQPQGVYALSIATRDGPAAELAGCFLVSQDGAEPWQGFLFTPVAGLEAIADVRAAVEQRLADPRKCEDLLRCVPIEVRGSLRNTRSLILLPTPVNGRAFAAVQQSLFALRQHNLELLRERLIRLPSLGDAPLQALMASTAPEVVAQVTANLNASWSAEHGGLSLRVLAREVMGDRFFQQLLQARHRSQVDPQQFEGLKALLDASQPNGGWQAARLSLLGQDVAEVHLAGLFHAYLPGSGGPLFLFSDRAGLERFDSGVALKEDVLARLRDPRQLTSLLTHVSRDQQDVLPTLYNVIVEAELINGDPFGSSVQAIIDKQVRDLVFLTNRAREQGLDMTAVVDHALDVRSLLDPALLALSTEGRWSTGLALERETTPALGPMPQAPALALARERLHVLSGQAALMLLPRPELRPFAQARLKEQLVAIGLDHLEPKRLVVQIYASDPARSATQSVRESSLVDCLLERVTGCNPLPADNACIRVGVYKDSPAFMPVDGLGGAQLPELLARSGEGFVEDFSRQLRTFYSGPRVSAAMAQFSGSALRYAVHVKRGCGELSEDHARIVSAALDRPLRRERCTLNGFAPDVCALSLQLPGRARVVNLGNCFVITERGGTDTRNSASALLWTGHHGLEAFTSLNACLDTLLNRLRDSAGQWSLLHCIGLGEQAAVKQAVHATPQAVLCVPNVIETNWLDTCQRGVTEQNVHDIEFLLRQGAVSHVSAQSLVNQLASYWSDHPPIHVDAALEELRNQVFVERLPAWLRNARLQERQEYAELMLRYRQAGAGVDDYSHGVPAPLDYARGQLKSRLKADFPALDLDPDAIQISVVQYSGPAGGQVAGSPAVSRLTRSLTYFALSNFYEVPAGLRSYRSANAQPLPAGLDDQYVVGLVRALDLAAGYRTLLTDTLTPGRPGVAARQAVFARQVVPQLLEQALQARLKGEFGATAYGYLRHVLDSPDASAREPYRGVELVFRPLAFRAIEGRHPDIARGLYLIGPAALDTGPQILYTLYHHDFTLMTFDHGQGLLDYLYKTPPLQQLVLQRLAPRARKIYAHDGFYEPHIGYVDPTLSSPVQANPPAMLVNEAVGGNLLNTLYDDTLHLRLAQAQSQSHSVAESDRASLEYLLSLLANTALLVLPGKLTLPLMVWQGEASVQASVESAAQDRWGQALFEFANGLLMLESARLALTPGRPAVVSAEPAPAEALPSVQMQGLRPYEAHDVVLADLHADPATGIYTHGVKGDQYIPLQGRVFQIVQWRERWRIYIGEGRDGPLVKRNERQRWGLDLAEPLLGGGQAMGRQGGAQGAVPDMSRTINTSGMRTIERLYPAKAQIIRQAHEQALRYLRDCQQHLQSVRSASELSAQVRAFLERIFGVPAISNRLLDKLRRANDKILTMLQGAGFSPLNSNRYHLYTPPWNNRYAQVVQLGTFIKHPAVLLAEKFFAPADEVFKYQVFDRAGVEFDRVKHATATILIHEFSHAALDTLDINYLSTHFPFEELLVAEPQVMGVMRRIKQQLQNNRYQQLSTTIPRRDLFKEKYLNVQRYMPLEFRLSYHLMQMAGCKTIEQVQDKFMSDPVFREDVILRNADSVALLITWLGYFKPPAAS